MISYLISGASRGIGFALTERIAIENPSSIIYAGARKPESGDALEALAKKHGDRIKVIQLDPTSQSSVDVCYLLWKIADAKAAVKLVEEQQGSLDVLINNAGTATGGVTTVVDMDLQALQSNFDINVIGVARLTNAALPLLRKSSIRQIHIISSIIGSVEIVSSGMAVAAAYSPTKSAATMLGVHYSVVLKPEDFTVKILHPGYVRTEMGGPDAYISVEESIDGLYKVISTAKKDDPVALINYDGTTIPW